MKAGDVKGNWRMEGSLYNVWETGEWKVAWTMVGRLAK